MEVAEIPPAVLVATSDNRNALANAIKSVVGTRHITYFDIIYGEAGSARLFLTQPRDGAVRTAAEYTPDDTAYELLRFSSLDARYPPSTSGARHSKAWAIYRCEVSGMPAVIARAVWI